MRIISRYLLVTAITAVAPFLVQSAVADAANGLVPHRAVYAMNLTKSGDNGGLSGARGVMTYEFRDQCDAWTVESKVFLLLRYGNHPEVENVRSIVTWEAKDGLGFRFRVSETTNGKLTEEIKGVAALDGVGLAGIAEYTKPSAQRVVLKKGTVFPTAHIKSLIERSAAGDKHLTKAIFDGATMDNPYEVSAVIGAGSGTAKLSPRLAAVLKEVANWKMRLAYFPVYDGKQTPDVELGVEMREDGIVKKILQDFGKYAVEARLDQVELLKPSGC